MAEETWRALSPWVIEFSFLNSPDGSRRYASKSIQRGRPFTHNNLRQPLVNNFPGHVGQAKIAALKSMRQLQMI